MECSLFNTDERLCLLAPPSSNNLGCGWCVNKCVELKCEFGIFSGYDSSICDTDSILSTSSNGTHVCAGAMTMTFALASIELILLICLLIITLSFNCRYMTRFINTACNPTKNYRKKFSNILSIFHYIVALIFGTVTLLYSFISLQSESDSSIITWPYMVLLIVWCDIGGLMDLIPYWILPYNNIDNTTHLHLQTKRNRSVLFKIIAFITYLLIYFLTVYAAMFADNIFHRYQSTLLITSIVWCLFLYVILPLPTTYSFWIQNMLNQSASIKQLLRAQKKYLKRLRKQKQKRKQQQRDNEEMMSQTDTNTNNSRLNLVTPQFQGQKGNEEFTFTPSMNNNKYLLNNRQFRSNSDPSSSSNNNRKWSFSNQNKQNELLWFQLSSADMNQIHYKKSAKMTFSTTEHNQNDDDKQHQHQHHQQQQQQQQRQHKKVVLKNNANPISPYKKRKKLGIGVSQIYRQRNGNYPANIRIDPYRRGFYFFLWILALSVNIISYLDYKHSIFWDGVLIMFIYIIFKRFDHLLIVVINPLYRKCCAVKKRKQHQTQYKRLQIDKNNYRHDHNNHNNNDIELDIKPNIDDRNKKNKSELKEPLMAKDGVNSQNNTIAPQIEILREVKEDSDDSDSDDSSESADVYGPGSLAEGRVDEGYIGDRIFGVQMDFVSFAPTTQQGAITGGMDMNTLGNLGTIYQSQPL